MTDNIDVVRGILDRTNDVRSWPADEQALHRAWTGDFVYRRDALIELRLQKILAALQPALATPGIALLAAERVRQIDTKGFSLENDRGRAPELLAAADSYLLVGANHGGPDGWVNPDGSYAAPGGWPWGEENWDPSEDRVRNLTISGSLIAAAIDDLSADPHAAGPTR